MFNKKIQRQIKKISKKIHSNLLRDIIVYGNPTTYNCPNCYFDSNTGKSSGVYNTSFTTPVVINGETISPQHFSRGRCPICHGKGEIEVENRNLVRCYIMWDPSGDLKNTVVGIEGSNVVLVKANECYYSTLRDCIYAEIDGIRCELVRPPVIRKVGYSDLNVVTYFKSAEEGYSTSD